MAFSNKRGRPKTLKLASGEKQIDLGTAELQKKRQCNLTKEAIDICRDKGIIDDEQHSAALHFRWLYTLRFGAAGVSALDLNGLAGRDTRAPNEAWQADREREYAVAVEKLRAAGALKIIMNIAVFNCRPQFLRKVSSDIVRIRQNTLELARLRGGLNALSNNKTAGIDRKNHKLGEF